MFCRKKVSLCPCLVWSCCRRCYSLIRCPGFHQTSWSTCRAAEEHEKHGAFLQDTVSNFCRQIVCTIPCVCTWLLMSFSCSFKAFICNLYSDTCFSICRNLKKCLVNLNTRGQDYFQSVTFLLVVPDNLLCITHKLSLQLVLLLRLLQDHVCLSEFGLQQFLLEVPVFEYLLQVLEKDNEAGRDFRVWISKSFLVFVHGRASVPPPAGRIVKWVPWVSQPGRCSPGTA